MGEPLWRTNPDKFLTLVAQAAGVAAVHFLVFMASIAFSAYEGGGRPVFAQTLMYVLAFPLIALLFLLPDNVGSRNWGEAVFIGVAVLNSGLWGAVVIWAARHWKRRRGQAG